MERFKVGSLMVLMVVVGLFLVVVRPAYATHNPANKTGVAGSSTVVFSPQAGAVTILSETIKSSDKGDWDFKVSLECTILSRDLVDAQGNPALSIVSHVGILRVWVEIDGLPVKVDERDRDGKVNFCDRAYRETEIVDEIVRVTQTANTITVPAHSHVGVPHNHVIAPHTHVESPSLFVLLTPPPFDPVFGNACPIPCVAVTLSSVPLVPQPVNCEA